jgi:hypothetical protein
MAVILKSSVPDSELLAGEKGYGYNDPINLISRHRKLLRTPYLWFK